MLEGLNNTANIDWIYAVRVIGGILICSAAILFARKFLAQKKHKREPAWQVINNRSLPHGAPDEWRPETDSKPDDSKEPALFPTHPEEGSPLTVARKRAECQMLAFYVWCLEHPDERVDRGDGRRALLKAIVGLNIVFTITDSTQDLALLRKYHKLLDSERLGSSIRRPRDF